jgi:hypothetical protein
MILIAMLQQYIDFAPLDLFQQLEPVGPETAPIHNRL